MLEGLSAWIELFKLGNVGSLSKDVEIFYRGNVIKALKKEGWFEYFKNNHTLQELAEKYQYTDLEFLKEIVDALVEDKSLIKVLGNKFTTATTLNEAWVFPRVFQASLEEVLRSYAEAIPERLKGKLQPMASGFNLFNWDDALTSRLYGQMRRSAFAFAGSLIKPGILLDLNCGNGDSTAAIWASFLKRHWIAAGSSMKIFGMDSDEHLMDIAQNEFTRMATKHTGLPANEITPLKDLFPEFKIGTPLKIPFEDNSVDMVYSSQLLHWTNAKDAIKEMLRVVKPGGVVFGSQRFFPAADKFPHLHVKVIEGAGGFFFKKDFVKWAKEAGAKKIKTATPVAVFKIIKPLGGLKKVKPYRYFLDIPHSTKRVWATMQDYTQWSEFAKPMVTGIDVVRPGDATGNGLVRRVNYKLPFGKTGSSEETVHDVTPEVCYTYTTAKGTEGTIRLEILGPNKTRIHFEEHVRLNPPYSYMGPLIKLFMKRGNKKTMLNMSKWLSEHLDYRGELIAPPS